MPARFPSARNAHGNAETDDRREQYGLACLLSSSALRDVRGLVPDPRTHQGNRYGEWTMTTANVGPDPAFAASPSSLSSLSRPSGLQSGVGFVPGPWHVVVNKYGEAVLVHTASDDTIVLLDDGESAFDWDEVQSTARLIAAAPELFAALRYYDAAFRELCEEFSDIAPTTGLAFKIARARQGALAALALAAGTQRAETNEDLAQSEGFMR